MIIPVQCFTCGKVTGNKWELYVKMRKEGKSETEALDGLRLKRPCCRTVINTHVDLLDRLLRFKAMENEQQNVGVQMTGGDDGYDEADD